MSLFMHTESKLMKRRFYWNNIDACVASSTGICKLSIEAYISRFDTIDTCLLLLTSPIGCNNSAHHVLVPVHPHCRSDKHPPLFTDNEWSLHQVSAADVDDGKTCEVSLITS